MQIRLTVLVSRGGQAAARPCDVLVTAPPGTVLAAVTDSLAATVAGATGGAADGPSPGGQGAPPGPGAHDAVTVHHGTERLDPQRRVIGEPPLIDGAVLALYGPAAPPPASAYGPAKARLHVTAGPDAGGVHLLHGGAVQLGRSADADVALDDPDVSRLHCTVTVTDGGAVTVTDLASTNGTSVDGTAVDGRPAMLRTGAVLRLGESAVRLEASPPAAAPPASLPTVPDGEGQLRLAPDGARDEAYGTDGGAHGHRDGQDDDGRARRAGAPPARHEAAAPGGPGTASAHAYAPVAPFPGEGTRGAGWAGPPDADGRAYGPGSRTGPDGGADDQRARRGRGLGAWARRLAGPGDADDEGGAGGPYGARTSGPTPAETAAWDARWPDPATVLLTALGPGPRLWERGPDDPEALTVRLGRAHRSDGSGGPVTLCLPEEGSVGLAGPRPRLAALARSVLAQLAALHAPGTLEIVLVSADRGRSVASRTDEWGWLGWLPHVRPGQGQDCRLLLAYDTEQAAARTAELARRLDESAAARAGRGPAGDAPRRPYTVLVVDGDPGTAELRRSVTRLVREGPAAGVHVLCLADTAPASPTSPLAATVESARAVAPPFAACATLALLSGAVATAVRVVRRAPAESAPPGGTGAAGGPEGPSRREAPDEAYAPAGPGMAYGGGCGDGLVNGTIAAMDGVSGAWAERFARALAPLREAEPAGGGGDARARALGSALPQSCRLLDELGLARATPAAVLARWGATGATGGNTSGAATGRAPLVLGAGPRGTVGTDLAADRGHATVTGPPGSGRTELLRAVAASLSAGERPDRLGLVLVDGGGGARDGGLRVCADLPHVTSYLTTGDPVRMREFAQALSGELKRRAELVGEHGTYEDLVRDAAPPGSGRDAARGRRPATGHGATGDGPAEHGTSGQTASGRAAPGQGDSGQGPAGHARTDARSTDARIVAPRRPVEGDLGPSRVRPAAPADGAGPGPAAGPPPRLVVLVDDVDALVDPGLGDPGRPAAGSVVRALESVARDGVRLGVHLVTASGRPDRTGRSVLGRDAAVRVELAGRDGEEATPGRGLVRLPDGSAIPFQAGRVTGRIPRTATVRPTVVPLDWARLGDPPTRRPVRELGNGPTDLALLASAMERAAKSLGTAAGSPGAAGTASPAGGSGPEGPGTGTAGRGEPGRDAARGTGGGSGGAAEPGLARSRSRSTR
ncbi:FHA domain-containing protein [Streptomyces sp. Z26]|uniref:FHA domain-containing protein n=1 Tax=Streptomyces sp. Z26 TaxID=2500177 RepID=UPI000EF13874|nr:FHA domain-containing protein [Streptomyces sp. Z26]RLL67138.1 FHA domain-containing protein [Streptomyces sp. Z26]